MSLASLAPVLAHQGGWDEILMVLAPLALLFGILMLANRRARALAAARGHDGVAVGEDEVALGDTDPGTASEAGRHGSSGDTTGP